MHFRTSSTSKSFQAPSLLLVLETFTNVLTLMYKPDQMDSDSVCLFSLEPCDLAVNPDKPLAISIVS